MKVFNIGCILLIILSVLTCQKGKSPEQNAKSSSTVSSYFDQARNATFNPEKLTYLRKAFNNIQENSDSLQPIILDHLIYYSYAEKQYDSALKYSQALFLTGKINRDTSILAKSYYRKARTYLYLDEPEKVIINNFKAQQLYKKIRDSINTGRRLVELANAQNSLGNFAGAQESATEALLFLNKTDSTFVASAFNAIALSNTNLEDLENSIKGYQQALKYAGNSKDSAIIYNNIALINISQKNYTGAISLLEKNENLAKDSPVRLMMLDNLYYSQWLNSRSDVISNMLDILRRRELIDDKKGSLSSYNHISRIYAEKNRKQALNYAQKYLEAAQNLGDKSSEIDALRLLISLAPSTKTKTFALRALSLKDSIEKSRTKAKNLFSKIKYDEEQKLKEINNLQKESAIKQLELTSQKNQKTLVILLAFIIITAGSFIFYYFRQRHRKEKIQKIYDTETRLSKKVHDELANDIFQIMTDKSIKDPFIIDRLDNVYHRTRDISKENSLIHTGADFSDELQGMISSTIPSTTKNFIIGLKDIEWDFYNKEKKIVIYRVVQELLVNFRKHSKASRLNLRFENLKGSLKIIYKDNGQGTVLIKEKFSGLRNMENRINLINGTITFQSEPGSGFSCQINIRS